MASVADIWNMALGLIASDATIQDPDEEQSKPARTCRVHWETVRDEVLRDFVWPKLKQVVDLTLVEEQPNDGIYWQYSYAYPDSCARLVAVLNGATRLQVESNVQRFEIGRKSTDGSALIYTDLEDAQVEFIYHETETARYDSDMVSAMAHLLASRIAPAFGPEAVKLGDRALRVYVWRMAQSQANALNEQRPDMDQASSWERARGDGGSTFSSFRPSS